jgi:hypothetical protein
MSEIAIIPPTADLAARIQAAHEAAQSAMRSAVIHAVEAGRLLMEAKKLVRHGNWTGWLKQNCEFSERTAQGYIRLARELSKLAEPKAQRVADLSLREALKAVSSGARRLSPLPDAEGEIVLGRADEQDCHPAQQPVVQGCYDGRAPGKEPDGQAFQRLSMAVRKLHQLVVDDAVSPTPKGLAKAAAEYGFPVDQASIDSVVAFLTEFRDQAYTKREPKPARERPRRRTRRRVIRLGKASAKANDPRQINIEELLADEGRQSAGGALTANQ